MSNKHKDLTGQRFGTLQVTGMMKKGSLYHAVCRCDCGNEKTFAPCNLRRSVVSCGCLPRARKPPQLDLTGSQYGKLTVTAMAQVGKTPSGKTTGAYYAICRCDCGTEHHPVLPGALRRGATTSCGCRRDQYLLNSGENSAQFRGFKGIRSHFWRGYQKSAAARGLSFEITIEYAWGLFERQSKCCALSGVPLVFEPGRNSRTTASMDRLDNSIGYIEGNVQWVHKRINLMRNILPVAEFVDWCGKVVSHDQLREGRRYGPPRV